MPSGNCTHNDQEDKVPCHQIQLDVDLVWYTFELRQFWTFSGGRSDGTKRLLLRIIGRIAIRTARKTGGRIPLMIPCKRCLAVEVPSIQLSHEYVAVRVETLDIAPINVTRVSVDITRQFKASHWETPKR
jgi:hypothetical protein